MSYIVGDIHGEYKKLKLLIKRLNIDKSSIIIFIGDYIDKGTNSKLVIDFLLKLKEKYNCVFLKGNHEYKFVCGLNGSEDAIYFLNNYGGLQTLKSYLGRNHYKVTKQNMKLLKYFMPNEHICFLKNTIPYYKTDNLLVTHAGIDPKNKNLNKIKEEFYFTRDNFINFKGEIIDRRIVFGHTAFKEPYFDPYKVGIDTGAVYKKYGRLTAYNFKKGYCINHLGEIIKDPYFYK